MSPSMTSITSSWRTNENSISIYTILSKLNENLNHDYYNSDLCKLRLAILAARFVAIAASKLEIPFKAADHQKLLVLLGTLR